MTYEEFGQLEHRYNKYIKEIKNQTFKNPAEGLKSAGFFSVFKVFSVYQ